MDTASTPFLLYLAYYSPHVPIEGKEELVEYYRQKRGAERAKDTTIMPSIHYAAMVHSIDRNIGRLLDRLEQNGKADSTMVLFKSDNGGLHVISIPGFDKHTPPMSNAPLREGKGYTYEGGNRVPLIAYYPGGIRGAVVDAPVVGSDVFNTLLTAAGDTANLTDGESLLPLITDVGTYPEERTLVWHNPHYNHQGHKPSSAIRRGDMKLIHFYETEMDELYDLSGDASEAVDLAAERPELAAELRAELMRRLRRMGARFPEANPEYVGG